MSRLRSTTALARRHEVQNSTPLLESTFRTVAIIVHWGPVEPTVKLVSELVKIGSITVVVVVANDGRTRPSTISEKADWLVPTSNLGFGGGFRFGCDAYPDTDVYLLLNNDVSLPEWTVNACLDVIRRNGVGIVGPTLVGARGVNPEYAWLTPLFRLRARRRPVAGPTETNFVAGAIMFIRTECHRQVPMDPRFFLFYEDLDLAHRVRAAGWQVMISPYQAWHRIGGTIPRNSNAYYSVRNRLWFARIHGRRWQTVTLAVWLTVVFVPRATAAGLLRGYGLRHCRFRWRGLLDGIGTLPAAGTLLPDEPRTARWDRNTGRPGPPRDRAHHQPRPTRPPVVPQNTSEPPIQTTDADRALPRTTKSTQHGTSLQTGAVVPPAGARGDSLTAI